MSECHRAQQKLLMQKGHKIRLYFLDELVCFFIRVICFLLLGLKIKSMELKQCLVLSELF